MASTLETTPPVVEPTSSVFQQLAQLARTGLKAAASLQLTVALLGMSVILVFFGTLAQKNSGLWTVVDQYFWSTIVWIDLNLLIQFGQIFFYFPSDWVLKLSMPFIGGKLLGFLMFFNLLAAHATRFKLTWKRSGIFILHGGILLLFFGEFITREFQVEQQMSIQEGESADFSIDTRHYELAFFLPSDATHDKLVTVPASRLRKALTNHDRISHEELPVDIEVERYLKNSRVVPVAQMKDTNPATEGAGKAEGAVPADEISGVDMGKDVDIPSAYVTFFKKGTGEKLGTYLVSRILFNQKVAGETPFEVALRNIHYYKPFSLYLIKFRFDRYVGTQTPKNFSSQLRLTDPENGQDREVMISMNRPLRYRGETFFQASYDAQTERGTVLQVVRNPGWLLPYIACILVTVGMLIHFCIGLVSFMKRGNNSTQTVVAFSITGLLLRLFQSKRADKVEQTSFERAVPWIVLGLVLLCLGYMLVPKRNKGSLNLSEVARLPVVEKGRVKPLDTVARVNLRMISHKEGFAVSADDTTLLPAIRWFMDAASEKDMEKNAALKYKIFRIESHQLQDMLGLKPREGFRYAIEEFKSKFDEFDASAKKAMNRPEKERDLFEHQVLELRTHIEEFLKIWQGVTPLALPPSEGKEWRNPNQVRTQLQTQSMTQMRPKVLEKMAQAGLPTNLDDLKPDQQELAYKIIQEVMSSTPKATDPALEAWENVLIAYKSGDQAELNDAVRAYQKLYDGVLKPDEIRRVRFETYLNETGLYYQLTYFYACVLLLSLAGWVGTVYNNGLGEAFRKAAYFILFPVLLAHTFTLISRMMLMDRPLVFVTNLYSSAVFIGWVCVWLCMIIEKIFPLGVGNFIAALMGGGTCIIAHNLAASGDTLEMMQAVLDDNFWLASHVTTVTMGYSATYVAGFLGMLYVIYGLFTPTLSKPFTLGSKNGSGQVITVGRAIGMVLYGVICFATLLSFVGTVLGGIWADQSWGRFWGWDPKENGAVLIVAWNTLILHARWAGLIKDRGMAILAILGNMITTWSWFGTNQLGVGLHAYGFSKELALVCTLSWTVFMTITSIALAVPKDYWVSFAREKAIAKK